MATNPDAVPARDDGGRDAEFRGLVHDLRNALNSLLMNTAVLCTKLPPDARGSRFEAQVEVDGARCAALLDALSAHRAGRPPGAA